MNSTTYPLSTPIQQVINITQYNVSLYNFTLNTSVTISVNILDENNRVINSLNFMLEGEDYQNWGNDDAYIKTFVETKINELYSHPATTAS